MKICKIENCNNKVHARMLCKKHYAKEWYHLHPEKKIEYRIKHPDRYKAYQQEYFKKNRDRILKKREETKAKKLKK